ncbi:MAG TPA: hypothetical protein P5080_03950 [Candidatus Paceibacterota bacterium]|nr:hypothetical protein [Candidatus Pacearchaeota archaeon]HRZ51166.1 hypothetical protein [Candidatus Paceibacterota bacterium]HSA36827.1 hypothetical protein [Candidatus Paceibacterota bacterium]
MADKSVQQQLLDIVGPLVRDASASRKDSFMLARMAIKASQTALAATPFAKDTDLQLALNLGQRWIDGEDVKDEIDTERLQLELDIRKGAGKDIMLLEMIASTLHGALQMRLQNQTIDAVSGAATALGANIFSIAPTVITSYSAGETAATLNRLVAEIKDLASQ